MSDGTEVGIFSTIIFIVGSVCVTYALSVCVDKYCSADVDEAIIRRIEELNQDRPKKIPAILAGMEIEERLRVLDRVLDFRPWSKELSAQVKLEMQKKEENDNIMKMEKALVVEDEPKVVNDTAENIDADIDPEEKPEELNILQKVWNEFGDKGNGNKRPNTKDEVTETCAICMEDYEDNEDVVIGESCGHLYHKECLLKWMQAKHDFCPYCRSYSFSVPDFIKIAREQLGEGRFNELVENDDPELVARYISGSTGLTSSVEGTEEER